LDIVGWQRIRACFHKSSAQQDEPATAPFCETRFLL
jgi:hypothetical protein